MLVQCLQRKSHILCLRWVERLRPFFETYTGPCRDNYRFWPGFLLFVRSGVYTLNSLIPAYTDVFFRIKMLVTAAVLMLVMSLELIIPQGIYKKWPINILEFSFYLNLCITSGYVGFSSDMHRRQSVVYTSVSITCVTFLGILAYHLHTRLKDTNRWKKLINLCSCTLQSLIHRKSSKKLERENEKAPLLPQTISSVVDFNN